MIVNSKENYNSHLKAFLGKDSRHYIGDKKAVSWIYQKNQLQIDRYLTAVQNGHKSSTAIKKSFNAKSTKYQPLPLELLAPRPNK